MPSGANPKPPHLSCTFLHTSSQVSHSIKQYLQALLNLSKTHLKSSKYFLTSGRLFERCSHNSPTVAKPGSVPNSTNSPNEVRGSSFTGSMTNDKEYEETLYLSITTYQRSQTSPKQHSYFNLQSMLRLEVLSVD